MIKQKSSILFIFSVVILLGLTLFVALLSSPATEVRGKSAARPLTYQLSAEQRIAQDIAMAHPAVQAYTTGNRSEVFGVREMGQQTTQNSTECADADCRLVEIYSFDTNATTSVILNLETDEVLDVLHQPGLQPGINKRLADLAVEIAMNDPVVIAALGFKPTKVDMSPVAARLAGTSCDGGHLCAGPTFRVGNRVLWAVVDLTEEKVAGIDWTEVQPDGPSETYDPQGGFCPSPGSVNRDGWMLNYETMHTDGLAVHNVSFNGRSVLTSAKLVEWHVDYNGTYFYPGFFDIVGCGNLGQPGVYPGFPIAPYQETQIVDLMDGPDVVGFELVQDFRMPNWGAACNYRYEQRMQFWQDGRFRIVSGAFGRGCGDSSVEFNFQPYYRPVVRIDIAVDGDDNDSLYLWDGIQWQEQISETYRTPYAEVDHGPHHYTTNDAIAAVVDTQNFGGYFIVPSQGQFNPEDRPDEPFFYVTQHNVAEGDVDLPIMNPADSYKYNDDHRQGPDMFINNENVSDTNIVLWYVAQHGTDRINGDDPPYCWTVTAPTEAYPCYGGPMFVPFGFDGVDMIIADFEVNGNEFAVDAAVFSSTSVVPDNAPAIYQWDFGDGITMTTDVMTATHSYLFGGIYTPTLTLSVIEFDPETAVGQPITSSAKNNFIPFIIKPEE